MNRINKPALKAAIAIHEQLAKGTRQDMSICLPEYSWNQIQRLRQQIDLACRYGWHGAVKLLTEDLAGVLETCRSRLEDAIRLLQTSSPERQAASTSNIYRDILALSDEFEDVEIDPKGHTLSVTTDRIVLEDIRFGAFEIRLDWKSSGSSPPYRVAALDPHPAAQRDDTTHPHVQDERLCEGDGRTAIQAALAEGRMYDFFLLVSQVLHTYGRGSAYVELEDWSGVPCDDCGQSLHDEDRSYCFGCESTMCDSCAMSCQQCGETFCSDCLQACAACGFDYCSNCLATCPVCRKRFCEDCREAGMCRSCHERQRNEETNNDPSKTEASKRHAGRRRRTACAPA